MLTVAVTVCPSRPTTWQQQVAEDWPPGRGLISTYDTIGFSYADHRANTVFRVANLPQASFGTRTLVTVAVFGEELPQCQPAGASGSVTNCDVALIGACASCGL